MTQEQARAKLSSMVAATQEPTISDPDGLNDLLEDFLRYAERADDTAYAYGSRMILTGSDYNGRAYRCIEGGTSAEAGEGPDWPVNRRAYLGQQFTDGTVLWEDDGEAFAIRWDLSGAAHKGWMNKAAATAHLINFASGPDKVELEQRHKHCLEMAARFAPMWVV